MLNRPAWCGKNLRIPLVAIAIAACDFTSSPELRGSFELAESNGQSLPVEYIQGSTIAYFEAGQMSVEADSLRLRLLMSEGSRRGFKEQAFAYTRSGDSIVIASPEGSGGRISGGTVRMRVGFRLPRAGGPQEYAWHDMVFVR